jgi:glycosyltransferase involved in cell wall biosynthesis
MKVLFDHHQPFSLAHGGLQGQIEQTRTALEAIGLVVEPLRWWDPHQTGDIIHYFGRLPAPYIEQAHQKGVKVVMSDLMGALGARPAFVRAFQRLLMQATRRILPYQFTLRLAWDSYQRADACIALTPWEATLMTRMFGASPRKVHIVPNGVEEVFLKNDPKARGPWLVCTATIRDVKRVLELARAAVAAEVPLWFIGKPYSENDSYARQFCDFARQNQSIIRYNGPIESRAELADVYRSARGFVLLSAWESLSIAALEAAACGCPLLLSDQPWARSVFDGEARFCPVTPPSKTAATLREFYAQTPSLPPPRKPKSWHEVGEALNEIYKGILDKPGHA